MTEPSPCMCNCLFFAQEWCCSSSFSPRLVCVFLVQHYLDKVIELFSVRLILAISTKVCVFAVLSGAICIVVRLGVRLLGRCTSMDKQAMHFLQAARTPRILYLHRC